MQFYSGLLFFIFLAILIVPAIILGISGKSIKLYSFIASILLLSCVFLLNTKQFLFLLLFYIFQVCIIKSYIRLNKILKNNSILYAACIFLSILPLFLVKLSGIVNINFIGFLGISYITFKVVQIIIESYDGIITELSVFDISHFILFFPVFSSGPIDRSRRYLADLNKVYTRSEYLDLLGDGIFKILLGVVYKFVLADIMFNFMSYFIEQSNFIKLMGYTYSYGFYLFFDFAGYSLMAIGTSYIFGIQTPKNFNKPFLSLDMKEFWNRWHITLSTWLRDFIFSRFMMKVIKKKVFKSRLTGASIGLILNMLIMGAWHGFTWYYVIYGLYHGIILAITEVYQKKSKFHKKNKSNKWYKIASWLITFNIIMFGFLIFSGNFIEVTNFIKR